MNATTTYHQAGQFYHVSNIGHLMRLLARGSPRKEVNTFRNDFCVNFVVRIACVFVCAFVGCL